MLEDIQVLSAYQGVYKLNYGPISFAQIFSAQLIGDPEGLSPSLFSSVATLLVWGCRAESVPDFKLCPIQF